MKKLLLLSILLISCNRTDKKYKLILYYQLDTRVDTLITYSCVDPTLSDNGCLWIARDDYRGYVVCGVRSFKVIP